MNFPQVTDDSTSAEQPLLVQTETTNLFNNSAPPVPDAVSTDQTADAITPLSLFHFQKQRHKFNKNTPV